MPNRTSSIIILFVLLVPMVHAQIESINKPPIVQTNDQYDYIEGKNVRMWLSNVGSMSYNPSASGNGFIWPKDSGKSVIFQDGVLFAGKIGDSLHVGGSTYRTGLQAGPLLPSGLPSDPDDEKYRIYKVRKLNRMVFDTMNVTMRNRFRRDFLEWPADDGAPFIDSNGNGKYDPDFDVWLTDSTKSDKPWFIGDEVAWFVMNDLDSTRTRALYGTRPIGFELHCLVWAYDGNPPLGNSIFSKYTLIHTGQSQIDSLYLGYWSDPDLGDAGDDYVGFDATLNLGYSYNGFPKDGVYGIPPAVGYVLLQGPIVQSPGDSALFSFGQRIDFRNLQVTTFPLLLKSDPRYGDPRLGSYQGAIETYRAFRGFGTRTNLPFVDPTTGQPTLLCLTGDPVNGTGWLQSQVISPQDIRMTMGCGPLTIAPGDTQEIVLGTVVAQGDDRLNSIVKLRDAAQSLRESYPVLPLGITIPPTSTLHVAYPTSTTARLELTAVLEKAQRAQGILKERDRSVRAVFPLYDDGTNGDSLGGDGIFFGAWDTTQHPSGVDLFIFTDYGDQRTTEWFLKKCVPLAGPLRASLHLIESDHLNFDQIANPGENIRFSVSVMNQSSLPIGPVSLASKSPMSSPSGRIELKQVIPANQSAHQPYDKLDAATYLTWDVPTDATDGRQYVHHLELTDTNNNCWCDSISIPVREFISFPIDSLAIHIAGPASGSLGWRVLVPSELHDRTYRVTVLGSDSATDKSVSILDLITNRYLIEDEPMPDRYAHGFPITEGWRLNSGTTLNAEITSRTPVLSTYIPPEREWLTPVNQPWDLGQWFFGSSLNVFDATPVKLIFDRNGQKAYNYLRGGSPSYGYQGYFDTPLRAYDISDTLNPRPLNMAFVEQSGGPTHNGTWDPKTMTDREYLFVFQSTYSNTPNTEYTSKNLLNDAHTMDILYASWLYPKTPSSTFIDGDYFLLQPRIPVSTRDTFLVNPIGIVNDVVAPPASAELALSVFPNPVMTKTTVTFTITTTGPVQLKLCDMLGRTVVTLSSSHLNAGVHHVQFNPKPSLAAGTYQLVLTSGSDQRTALLHVLK